MFIQVSAEGNIGSRRCSHRRQDHSKGNTPLHPGSGGTIQTLSSSVCLVLPFAFCSHSPFYSSPYRSYPKPHSQTYFSEAVDLQLSSSSLLFPAVQSLQRRAFRHHPCPVLEMPCPIVLSLQGCMGC